MNERISSWLCCGVVLFAAGELLADDTPVDLPETKLQRSQRECVRIDRIREYQFLDDLNLIVWAPNQRNMYHVELYGGCFEPSNAVGLRFYDNGSRSLRTFCAHSGFVAQDPLGRNPKLLSDRERCHARRVQALNEQEAYELFVDKGRVAPLPPGPQPEVEVRVPEDSKDSEVAGPADAKDDAK